jgi:chromosomal replication initiation ATPase DnaA
MAQQLSFELPTRVALGVDDFYVSPANAIPYEALLGWQNWPDGKLALVGPKGSGKSHLARVFQHDTDALILNACTLGDLPLDAPRHLYVVVEDTEMLAGSAAEEYLFHLHNHLKSHSGRLLLTSDRAPHQWSIALPDLASRMQAASVAEIGDPDDALLWAVLTKLFADRQLSPAPTVTTYLASRIDRSFAAAADIVAALDATALATGREINRGLAADVLQTIADTP